MRRNANAGMFCALALVVLAQGCGSKLDGTFELCDDSGSGTSQKSVITFEGENVTSTSTSHASSDCTGAYPSVTTESGTFKETDTDVEGATGGVDLTYTAGPQAGTTYYTIFKLDGDNLTFGVEDAVNDGSSEEKRTKTLGTDVFKKKAE